MIKQISFNIHIAICFLFFLWLAYYIYLKNVWDISLEEKHHNARSSCYVLEKVFLPNYYNNLNNNYYNTFISMSFHIVLLLSFHFGICGKTYCWFKIYLKIKQFCYVKGQRSSTNRINCGIPQGSCLGALLFIICINDFEYYLQDATTNLYTDCTDVTCSSNDSVSLLGLSKSKISSIQIFGLDFNEYSVIRRIWAWLGHEKGVDP